MTTRLESDRLQLNPLDEADEALYCRLYTDSRVMARIARPQTRAEAARGFRASLGMNAEMPNRRSVWTMTLKSSGSAVGLIGLDRDEPDGAEVGVVLPPEHQGRGFATEAIGALADHAFSALGLLRMHTRHAPDHGLAAGLMQSLGFEPIQADAGEHGWRWQLTPSRWTRRQRQPDPLP